VLAELPESLSVRPGAVGPRVGGDCLAERDRCRSRNILRGSPRNCPGRL